jgi:hypothetical protein
MIAAMQSANTGKSCSQQNDGQRKWLALIEQGASVCLSGMAAQFVVPLSLPLYVRPSTASPMPQKDLFSHLYRC